MPQGFRQERRWIQPKILALLAGALGADNTQGKDTPLSLADLQAAGSKLQKGCCKHRAITAGREAYGSAGTKGGQTDVTLTDLTDARQLLSALTPSLKVNALTATGKSAQLDEKTTTLSDEDLANLSALFAMLPGQPITTPVGEAASAPADATLTTLLRSNTSGSTADNRVELTSGEVKRQGRCRDARR